MIWEGLVTTINEDGSVHVTPMGPEVDALPGTLTLKPFSGRTHENLARTGEAVFHVHDRMLWYVLGTFGQRDTAWPLIPAKTITGQVLSDCCRYYELQVVSRDQGHPRERFVCEVRHRLVLREMAGFCRAHFAILEGCILASRRHLIDAETVAAEMTRLAPLVEKTGSPEEKDAWRTLCDGMAWTPP